MGMHFFFNIRHNANKCIESNNIMHYYNKNIINIIKL